ncbi:MAG: hypothetical protein ACK4RV_08315 [Caulobacter sp.]|jgi:hypothetical protein
MRAISALAVVLLSLPMAACASGPPERESFLVVSDYRAAPPPESAWLRGSATQTRLFDRDGVLNISVAQDPEASTWRTFPVGRFESWRIEEEQGARAVRLIVRQNGLERAVVIDFSQAVNSQTVTIVIL